MSIFKLWSLMHFARTRLSIDNLGSLVCPLLFACFSSEILTCIGSISVDDRAVERYYERNNVIGYGSYNMWTLSEEESHD
jgi:hypothetical protein